MDGHTYLEVLLTDIDEVPQTDLTQLLEEAIKKGSYETVKVTSCMVGVNYFISSCHIYCNCLQLLLDKGAKPTVSSRHQPLLHDAAAAKHDSMKKIKLLVKTFKDIEISQTNSAGFTLLHIGADSKPPRMDLIDFALEKQVDISKKDKKGDTALHKVVKNYRDREIPWDTSEQVMELLLQRCNVSPNISNKQGLTPFTLLVICINHT